MGLIGSVIKNAIRDFLEITVEVWPKDNRDSVHCGIPGIIGIPLEGDKAIIIDVNNDEAKSVFLGILTDQTSDPGDVMIFGRDSEGVIKVSALWKNDGSFRVENENGFFELKTDGQFNANDNMTVDP